MPGKRSARTAQALTLGAALIAAPAAASPLNLLFERSAMLAAHARCDLFSPSIAAALSAGRDQARREALRGGAELQAVREVEQRARGAGADCASAQLHAAAARVREAYEGYARLERMTFPGEVAAWRADRGSGFKPRWRLAQTASLAGQDLVFGLAGRDGAEALLAVAEFPRGRTPYAARLVMRDTSRTSGPYLDGRGVRAGEPLPLSRRLPPTGTRAFAAAGRSQAEETLRPAPRRPALAFRFPTTAASALAGLDPREAVALEFQFASAPEVVRAYVEVGDFAAGREFLTLPR